MNIMIGPSKLHGIGVFAARDLPKGNTIEVCPVLELNTKETAQIADTLLYSYFFKWRDDGSAMALGYGSLYNHSYEPNAMYVKDFEGRTLSFVALSNIKEGEEITVSYNGDPNDKEKVWFDQN